MWPAHGEDRGSLTKTGNAGAQQVCGVEWRDDSSCGISEPPKGPCEDGRGAGVWLSGGGPAGTQHWGTGRCRPPGPGRIPGGEGSDSCLRIWGSGRGLGPANMLCGHSWGYVTTGTAWHLKPKKQRCTGEGKAYPTPAAGQVGKPEADHRWPDAAAGTVAGCFNGTVQACQKERSRASEVREGVSLGSALREAGKGPQRLRPR